MMFGKSKTPRKRWIYIGVVIAAVLVVAIGLGLGLGLRNHDDTTTSSGIVGAAKDKRGTSSSSGPVTMPMSRPATTTVTKATRAPPLTTEFTSSAPPTPDITQTPTTTHKQPSPTTHKQPSPTTHIQPALTPHDTRGKSWIDEPCASRSKSCPWQNRFVASCIPCSLKMGSGSPPLLLVSLDGFRAEYLHRHLTPTIERLRDCGVHTPYMRATYPTLTFPNHYTIVTGLYPESHGIVDNNMYDPIHNLTFTLYGSNKYNPQWWGGEPIWTTAKKQGKRSAAMFWVGSDVNISGIQPDIWRMYDGSVTFEERVDTVLEWLSWPADRRPDLITLYLSDPDHTGHGSGPVSPEVDAMLGRVDKMIARLMDGLYTRDIHNCVNLIVLADHGMEATSCDRKVELSTYIRTNEVLVYDGVIGRIHKDYHNLRSGRSDHAVVVRNEQVMSEALLMKKLECKSAHYHAYTRRDIPVRHHYTNNPRIGDVTLDLQAKWTVSRKKSSFCLQGNHGYDNLYKSMQALFLAHGPGFKENHTTDAFENIELYNLMSDLLGIRPGPNNGTVGTLDDMLSKPPHRPSSSLTSSPVCVSAVPASKNLCGCDGVPLPSRASGQSLTADSLPFTPMTALGELQVCELTQTHFRTGYSRLFHLPVWSSFTLSSTQNVSLINTGCILEDSRVPRKWTSCYHGDNITRVFLYNPGLDSLETESRRHTNTVPMYTGFYTGIWRYVWSLIGGYTKQWGSIQVTTGPAFDYNSDGLWEGVSSTAKFVDDERTVAMPTHYYIILARCSDLSVNLTSCDLDRLDTMTFILPHLDNLPNCLPDADYLSQHVARIRDVELLTGLEFSSRFDVVGGAKLRTYLSTRVWEVKDAPLHWSDLSPSDRSTGQCPGKVPLLLISLDGFRANYIQRNLTPVIATIRERGVHTPYMRATFPTVTFPNHYTIVTGLYPESHGIISNKMYDEDIGKYFTIGSRTKADPRWWGGEPIWITAKKQNKTTATYFWPGSDVNISGIYPNYWKLYSGSAGYPERVATVLDWLTLPEDKKPDFITLYFDQPDHAGHQKGPESELENDSLRTVDMMIGRLMDGLYQRDLHDCVNIIIIADHGFDDTDCNQIVDLSKLLNTRQMLISSGTFGRIETKYSGSRKHIHLNKHPVNVSDVVSKLMCNTSVMKVFTKSTAPKRFHYLNNPRVGDILLDMADRWLVSTSGYYYGCQAGNHGWDNIFKSMHALFLAHGPAFKKNVTIGAFENIELYNLMAELLDVEPAPNNGTMGSLDNVLVRKKTGRQELLPVHSVCPPGQHIPTTDCRPTQVAQLVNLSHIVLPQIVPEDAVSVCTLMYPQHIVAYRQGQTSPIYTTFNLTADMVQASTVRSGDDKCVVDILDNLWPYEPDYPHFYKEIWGAASQLIREYAVQYGHIVVTLGSVYDVNGDGLADKNISTSSLSDSPPTHVFAVMMRCAVPNHVYPCRDESAIRVQSLVLPYLNFTPNCLYPSDYLKDNIARVRDVELLTGLRFFGESIFSASEAARLRTHLSEKLWPSDSIRTWLESSCDTDKDKCTADYKPLLLISLDGFRADYLLRNFTPYIGRLSQCGSHAPYMRSVYPTKTFPNHYSIVTGLYPESHGIVDNNMFDSKLGSLFKVGRASSFDPRWWGGEPIWRTVMNNNKSAATFFWPGSDVQINGEFPTYYKRYNKKVSYNERVDQVLSWLTNEKPELITLYFDEPDSSGHRYGPDNIVKIGQAQERVDTAIGQLMEGLKHRQLHNCINILLIADHGMSSISCDRLIIVPDYLSNLTMSKLHLFEGTFGRINNLYSQASSRSKMKLVTDPVPTSEILSNLTCHPHFKVFSKASFPKRHHYGNNPRIDDVILDVEDRWLVSARSPPKSSSPPAVCTGGNHGYDNTYKSMQALFLAHGPAFKENMTVKPFENIELYNLMTDVLGIPPAPNNGTEGVLNQVLRNPRLLQDTAPTQTYRPWRLSAATEKFIQDTLVFRNRCLARCNIDSTHAIQTSLDTEADHLPFGRPTLLISHNKTSVYIRGSPGHVTAYSTALLTPLWVSYTVGRGSGPSHGAGYPTCTLTGWERPQCQGVSFAQDNSRYVWTPLYRKPLTYSWESLISLNFVPMLENFRQGIWTSLQNLTDQYVQDYGPINVISGPIFDYNIDGHKDDPTTVLRRNTSVSIPSHFFSILSRCDHHGYNLTSCPPDQLRTLSFIIPHTDITNCQTPEDYLVDNEVRVRDIELLTDLQFYTGLPPLNSVAKRTYLPQGLWQNS